MKLDLGDTQVVVGKRVTLGAAIGSLTSVAANLFPEYSGAIVASATAITFLAQLIVVNFFGVTTRD